LWKAEQVVLTETQIRRLEKIAKDAMPFESCALLLGSVENSKVTVSDILQAKNRERSTVTFQIDPAFIFKAYQQADREGKELVVIFHSHPAPPRPSPTDLHYMEVNPVVWLILSTITNKIEGHQLLEGETRSVKVLIENNATD